jgi:multiple sugar transport system ATP-binding protein
VLMDEPLSNLDAKLRVHMRAEVSRIQRRLGVATLYVTHDQVEAMTMGDRVAVMRAGQLQQYAAPKHLYDRPTNLFVAAFIGSPAMNLYQATVDADGRTIALGDQRLPLPTDLTDEAVIGRYRGGRVVVGIRPEDLGDAALGADGSPSQRLQGTVDLVEELGAEKLVHFRIDAERLSASDELLAGAEEETEGVLDTGEIGTAAATAGVARIASRSQIAPNQVAAFTVDTTRLHLFDPDEGGSLRQD